VSAAAQPSAAASPPAVVTFLSDYGLRDEFVGVCHGVIATLCPSARIIDITHGIARHDILGGALLLASALPHMPVGVHIAVVDPGVGTGRGALALELGDGRVLVGPDNGLLVPAAQAAGGISRAVEISRSPLALERVSATFHGRDLFCPVAARLAAGTPFEQAGEPFDPARLVRLAMPTASIEGSRLRADVRLLDGFGNVQLAARAADAEALGLRPGDQLELLLADGAVHGARFVRAFAEVPAGELLLHEDSAGFLALAVNGASAAERLDLRAGRQLLLRRGEPGAGLPASAGR
jgi:S-adenosylmethionine hydrolase